MNKSKQIVSKVIDAADSYPVISDDNDYVAFIESYTVNNVTYYNVYYDDRVEKYSNHDGELRSRGVFNNISGLPVLYKNENPLDNVFGRSDLEDYQNILDSMEDLLSKSVDGFYKFITGIPIVTGQRLTNADLPNEIIGGGLSLDDGSNFFFAQNQFDHKAFETLYKHLMTSLLDISSTPAVSMGKVDISNLSEVSIKLLFSLADIKAQMTEKYIRESLMERFNKIRRLLDMKGIHFSDDEWDTVDVVFQYSRPQSEKDIIDNLDKLKSMGGISTESLLERSPYTIDVTSEMKRMGKENVTVNDDADGNDKA